MSGKPDSFTWHCEWLASHGGPDLLRNTLGGMTFYADIDFKCAEAAGPWLAASHDDWIAGGVGIGDGPVAAPGDDAVTENEIVLFDDTAITYLDAFNKLQTCTVTLAVWRTDDGGVAFRVSDPRNVALPPDLVSSNVVSIRIGTWNGVECRAALRANTHAPSPMRCFATGTLIKTLQGEVPIEAIGLGDQVFTLDCGYQPVKWIGSRSLSGQDLDASPWLRPIRIHAGALGNGMPATSLVVSPQHRVMLRHPVTNDGFETGEVLIAATHLLQMDGIEIAHDLPEVTYWHFMLGSHQLVFSSGAITESLFPSTKMLWAIHQEGGKEIFDLFPALFSDPAREPARARPSIPQKPGGVLVGHTQPSKRHVVS